MMVPENRIKKAIRENRVAVGVGLFECHTRGIAKLLEYAGLDWVMIDMEHAGYTIDAVADLIAWFKATPLTVLVRPPDNEYYLLSGIMDAGAMGVVTANVETAADARKIVDAVMYPPLGHRGVGLNGAHSDFSKPKASEYMPARNAQTSVAVMIESLKGLENVDEIAAVEGVDMLHPSYNDLSLALGVPQQHKHPKYMEAVRKVADACKRHGKALKYKPLDDANLAEFYDLGCRVMGIQRDVPVGLQDELKKDSVHLREIVAGLSKK